MLSRSPYLVTFFPIKEASRIQIKELLIKSKRVSVDPAEVERLLNERNVDGSYKSSLKGARIFLILVKVLYAVVQDEFGFVFIICLGLW